MSNSIWKTPDQKPDIDKQILVKNDFDYIIYFGKCAVAPKNKWAYIDELLAQADKAERLQKAVDLAQEHLLSISDGYDIMKADAETIKRLFYAIQDETSDTHKEIEQLIK